jgi:4-hydroxy-4-methyl-2-oxoglutarate aldolase
VNTDLDAWGHLSSATISDALDRVQVAGQCFGLKALDPGFRLKGRAFTIRMAPVGTNKGTVGDYIEDVPPGQVVVLDNEGRLDATVWGDILTAVAHRRGVAGTVIHGVCRDSALSLKLGYPMFSRGVYMRTGRDRVQAEGFHEPVSVGEIRVEPGDLIVGDGDGIVVVPQAREEVVLSAALEIHETEEKILLALNDGMALKEARKQFGYHQLQRSR